MKQIEFLIPSRPFGYYGPEYGVGDLATFKDELADQLVKRGSARVSPMDKQSGGRSQRQRLTLPVTKDA